MALNFNVIKNAFYGEEVEIVGTRTQTTWAGLKIKVFKVPSCLEQAMTWTLKKVMTNSI